MMISRVSSFLAFAFIAKINALEYEQGDTCGVEGSNFLDANFTGTVAVAGNGCTLGNNTNCLCAPDFTDGNKLSAFIWQCNGDVEFGPKGDKVCPDKVPVVKKVGVGSIDFTESLLGVAVPCNTSIHPTGRPGDESCQYSECESGGSFSAICGCVDLGNRTEVEASGMQWICLHSTCDCGEGGIASDADKAEATSSSLTTASTFTTISMTLTFIFSLFVVSSGL